MFSLSEMFSPLVPMYATNRIKLLKYFAYFDIYLNEPISSVFRIKSKTFAEFYEIYNLCNKIYLIIV